MLVTALRLLACLPALAGLSAPCLAQAPAAPPAVLVNMDRPLLFAYGTWEKQARVENGAALLDAEGMTPKGGVGVNLNPILDLRAHAGDSPALRLRIGPRNTLKTLKLTLNDTQGRLGTWQLLLLELFPAYIKALPLHIPKDALQPDLLNECRFELGLFHGLQLPDGGVRFGIGTNGDPIDGEVSWKQSMPAYVYAPDVQSSYLYAAVAARMARVLAAYSPAEARTYRVSALKAMAWAEADRAKRQASGT